MKISRLVTLTLVILALAACASATRTYLASDEDEDYGIGGTGIVAQNFAGDGVAVVGAITGFGSIFVNGIEVEDDARTIISINGRRVSNHEFEIGEVVEILTRDEQEVTGATLINVRHEVIGPVSDIDRSRNTFTILNQAVLAEDLPMNIKSGEFLAVAGFRDGKGQVHATHIKVVRSGNVLIRGQLDRSNNRMSMHGIDLAFQVQPKPEDKNLIIEGILEAGKIMVIRTFPDKVASLEGASTWVIQGFPASYALARKDNEGLKKIWGQSRPVIFRIGYVNKNKPAKVLLLPDNLPKGASVNSGHKNARPGNQPSPARGGKNSSGSGNSPGGNGNSNGGSGNNSGGGNKP